MPEDDFCYQCLTGDSACTGPNPPPRPPRFYPGDTVTLVSGRVLVIRELVWTDPPRYLCTGPRGEEAWSCADVDGMGELGPSDRLNTCLP